MSAPAHAAPLVTVFRWAQASLGLNLEGVSEEEALVVPQPGGNCANWITGHLLVYRDAVHTLLGLDPAWPGTLGDTAPYARGSRGFDTSAARPLADLRAALERSQALVLPALHTVSAARLAEPSGKQTVAERLAFLGFHEGYHAGQIGLLRRLLGKPGAIA